MTVKHTINSHLFRREEVNDPLVLRIRYFDFPTYSTRVVPKVPAITKKKNWKKKLSA